MKKSMNILKVVKFFYNNSIVRTVPTIFTDEKVGKNMAEHFFTKAQQYLEQEQNNDLAWMAFVGSLSENNLEILNDYVTNEYRG